MLDLRNKTLLVIAPHPDDEVISCAGLMSRVKAEGGKVHVLFLTVGATKDFGDNDVSTVDGRTKEVEAVMSELGVDAWKISFTGDEYHLRLDVLPQRDLIHEIERGEKISLETSRPDILVFPSFADYNQDHRAAAAAAFAACRPAPASDKHIPRVILSGEAPMEGWSFPYGKLQPNFYLSLSQEEMDRKVSAMELYASQVRGTGHPRHVDTLRTFAQVRGSIVGEMFAEGYFCHKIFVS